MGSARLFICSVSDCSLIGTSITALVVIVLEVCEVLLIFVYIFMQN